jgi:hypothetical protein
MRDIFFIHGFTVIRFIKYSLMIYFKIGCYVLIATCFLHLFGHFQEPIAQNETEQQLLDLMTNYTMNIGSETITMMGLQKGFSLLFSLLMLWPGVLGLYLAKTLQGQTKHLRTINFMYVGAMSIETAISLTYFFIIPTTCIVLGLLFFVIAAFRLK